MIDVKSHINNCITCSENVPNNVHHPQTALRNSQSSFCMYSYRYNWQVTHNNIRQQICTNLYRSTDFLHNSSAMPNKTAESVVEAYLSGILLRIGASMVCLSDNGSELKNNQMNTVLKQLGI